MTQNAHGAVDRWEGEVVLLCTSIHKYLHVRVYRPESRAITSCIHNTVSYINNVRVNGLHELSGSNMDD